MPGKPKHLLTYLALWGASIGILSTLICVLFFHWQATTAVITPPGLHLPGLWAVILLVIMAALYQLHRRLAPWIHQMQRLIHVATLFSRTTDANIIEQIPLEPRHSLTDTGISELDQVYDALLSLMEKIQYQDQICDQAIHSTHKDMIQALESLEEQNAALDIARKEAIQAYRLKSDFLANMSHEIRTPLNGIIGFTNMALKTPLESSQREYLMTISKSSDSLLSIINDILDFSKLEAGKLALEDITFYLHEIIEDVLRMLSPLAHDKHIELVHLYYADLQQAYIGDPLRIRQVLTNLINNAIKFTDDGSVCLRVTQEKATNEQVTLKIAVTDTGVGLSQADQQRLFNAFTQGKGLNTEKYGGTGLGLVISKQLILLMGGEIGVDSRPQQGTTFWFTLTLPTNPHMPAPEIQKGLANRNILIYDPAALTRVSLQHMLEHAGMQVTKITNIEQLLPTIDQIYSQASLLDALILGGVQLDTQHTQMLNTLHHIEKTYGIRCLLLATTHELFHWKSYPWLDTSRLLAKPVTYQHLYAGLRALLLDQNNPIQLPFANNFEQATQSANPAGRVKILCVDGI